MNLSKLDQSYIETLNSLKEKIKTSQIKAALSVNAQMICLYWEIGKTILERQQVEGWGSKVIDKLSLDLSNSFPEMKGFSSRNLKHMRRFAETYPDMEFVKQVVSQLPWGHNIVLLNKLKDNAERSWYAKKAFENGWSRNILTMQIESNLYQRQALTEKVTNFDLTLPKPQSDLAQDILKDPYKFDFLSLGDEALEREIEKELVKHITNFLLELGKGFAFVGRQYHLEIGGDDYYIDLLFYHLNLNCFIVIELKAGEYKPEYAGKLNFYLSAVDDLLKREHDNPSIGIILCKTKNKIKVEYSLRNLHKPIGVSEFMLVESIPEELKRSLPTIEEIEKELEDDL
jgi:predicted nuclease of restriction endonuclease-like (RecB) superfamily